MREIKFRAWLASENKMCKVAIINFDKGAFIIGAEPGADTITKEHYVKSPNNGRFCFWNEIKLMQFSGLHDKNGKEIYEGDVLQLENTHAKTFRRIEKFERGCFGHRDITGKFYPLAIPNGNKKDEKQWEVIGNIHENPELILPK
jgi:uncharacterized phage protein (TIGR01671 family)